MNIGRIADFQSVSHLNNVNKNQQAQNTQKASTIATDVPEQVKKSDSFHGSGYVKKFESKRNAIADDSATKHLTEAYERDINSYRNLVSKLMIKQSGGSGIVEPSGAGLADVLSRQITGQSVLTPKIANNIMSLKLLDPSTNTGMIGSNNRVGNDFWGVANTSKRLLDFGVNLASGDLTKLQAIKDAASNGFIDAEQKSGGKGTLSKVSYDTYDRLMNDFDLELKR